MYTAIILVIALAPLVLFGVAIVLAGLDEDKRMREQADYILRAGCLPPSQDKGTDR